MGFVDLQDFVQYFSSRVEHVWRLYFDDGFKLFRYWFGSLFVCTLKLRKTGGETELYALVSNPAGPSTLVK